MTANRQAPSSETEVRETPLLDVIGVGKQHGQRAVGWLRARNILAFYDSTGRTLRAHETKLGAGRTYELMHEAIDATSAA